jgi:hypothetical protein
VTYYIFSGPIFYVDSNCDNDIRYEYFLIEARQDQRLHQLDQGGYTLYSVATTPTALSIIFSIYVYVMMCGRCVR